MAPTCMTRRIPTSFLIFALHKSPTLHHRRQAGRQSLNNGSASPASDAPAPDDLGRARGRRGRRRHLLLLRGRQRRQPVLRAQQLVVAALRPRPGLALAVHPRVLAEPLQKPRGRHGDPQDAGGAERHSCRIGRRAIGGAEVILTTWQFLCKDYLGMVR